MNDVKGVKDVILIDDRWYVLATSSRADDHTRTLKHDELFGLFDRWGDIQHIGLGNQGLYFKGTRYLSRMEMTVNERRPLLLYSTIQEDNALMVVDLTCPDLYEGDRLTIRKGTVHLFRSKLLWEGCSYEHLRLHNYGEQVARLELNFLFEADFADIFEVRGVHRTRRGEYGAPQQRERELVLLYRGLDGVERRTRIRFSRPVEWRESQEACLSFTLEPGATEEFYLTVMCEREAGIGRVLPYTQALTSHRSLLKRRRDHEGHIFTSNEQFNDWLNRSTSDLHMLTTQTQYGPYPYAGIPWFSTPFGRDALITALQTLWLNPELSKGVLEFLAAHQAQEEDPARDAEPGKILHEMRYGEMAALGEVPFASYYGSVDSTPLFVMLAGAYYRRTGDKGFIRRIWANIKRALEWMERYGDRDEDGFIEYARHSENGLVQQGWKDSDDSVFHQDGTLAQGPIALCEVQGYAYQAWRDAAMLARILGEHAFAATLESRATILKQKFNAIFWCEDIQTFALALDGEKRPCRVRSSNVGHVLASGIADPALAERAVRTLMDPASFNGWGIRTIARWEARYNPMSYHNGSVWPHDTALVAAGFARYGHKDAVCEIMTGLFNASITLDLHRLPELFCGFDRLPGQGPTLYPVACSPQAWASGAVFHLLQSTLGLVFSPKKPQLRFHHPRLPDYLHRLEISNLRLPGGVVDLSMRRHTSDVGINVERKEGDIEIAVIV